MNDERLGALLHDSSAWPASGPPPRFAAVAEGLHTSHLQQLGEHLAQLAGQVSRYGHVINASQQPALERPPLTHALPSVLACGLRIARLTQRAGGSWSETLPVGAAASGSVSAWQQPATCEQSSGSNAPAVDSLGHSAAPAPNSRQGGGASAHVLPAALDACSWVGGAAEQQSALSSSGLAGDAADCQHNAGSLHHRCQDAGSTGGAPQLMFATLPSDAGGAQSWREPHAGEEHIAALRRVAVCSRNLEAAWTQQFAQPAALSEILGVSDGSQHSCPPDGTSDAAAAQLPWQQRLVTALQLLEVLIDSCVLGDDSQLLASAHASALATSMLKLLELHLHVRDILSQSSGKHRVNPRPCLLPVQPGMRSVTRHCRTFGCPCRSRKGRCEQLAHTYGRNSPSDLRQQTAVCVSALSAYGAAWETVRSHA